MLDTLYQKDKNKKIRFFKVWTEGPDVVTEYGEVGGKSQFSRETCIEKNIGKSNYLTADEQAIAQAKSAWEYKLKRKYHLTVEDCENQKLLPMLAKEYSLKKVCFPVGCQFKYDGFRYLTSIVDGEVEGITRSSSELEAVSHIRNEVAKLLTDYPDIVLDGEIYLDGVSFQEITRLAKKYRKGDTEKLEYHVYDLINMDDLDMTFNDRYDLLKKIVTTNPTVKLVSTTFCNTEEEINDFDANAISLGYEGTIVRNNSKYVIGHRSQDLMKLKQFEDAEFTIVSCKEGVGKFQGLATFILQNDLTDETFDACPIGTLEAKKAMWDNKESFYGERATVKFFGRTEAKLPRFPVMKGIRLPEDTEVKND
jgi:DNA ligase-1